MHTLSDNRDVSCLSSYGAVSFMVMLWMSPTEYNPNRTKKKRHAISFERYFNIIIMEIAFKYTHPYHGPSLKGSKIAWFTK